MESETVTPRLPLDNFSAENGDLCSRVVNLEVEEVKSGGNGDVPPNTVVFDGFPNIGNLPDDDAFEAEEVELGGDGDALPNTDDRFPNTGPLVDDDAFEAEGVELGRNGDALPNSVFDAPPNSRPFVDDDAFEADEEEGEYSPHEASSIPAFSMASAQSMGQARGNRIRPANSSSKGGSCWPPSCSRSAPPVRALYLSMVS